MLQEFYYCFLAPRDKSWIYFITHLRGDANYLQKWEKRSRIHFTSWHYAILLQMCLVKKWKLATILLEERKLEYITVHEPYRAYFLDSLTTNNLLRQDYAAWLAIIASHHTLHLLGLDKDYLPQDYYAITYQFVHHPVFKPLYMDKKRQELIIEHCHPLAKPMMLSIFLQLDLSEKHLMAKQKI